MCDLNDQEELKKYTRRDFGALAASAGLLTALPGVANAAAVAEREVTIPTPDGSCDAYFVAPTSGAAPGVLVWPDIFGLRPAFRQMGRRLAESGYSVLVVNPFYRQKKAPTAAQGGQTPIAEVMPLMQALTPAMHLSDGKAFVAWLDARSEVDKARKLGTTGYCMGGPIAVRTASVAPGRVGAVCTFHGAAMVTPAPESPHRLVAGTQARYLIAVAENDDAKEPEAKTTLRAAFESAKLPARGGGVPAAHGWCPPDSRVYDAAQAETRLDAAAGDVRQSTRVIAGLAVRSHRSDRPLESRAPDRTADVPRYAFRWLNFHRPAPERIVEEDSTGALSLDIEAIARIGSVPVDIALKDGTYFGNLCAIDRKPARVEDPRTIEQLELFAELIAAQLQSDERYRESERARLANSGPTIPPEVLARVFEPYWRPATSVPGGGLGLGLYICQQIAKAHGGSLSARSSDGTTRVEARLPAGAFATLESSSLAEPST